VDGYGRTALHWAARIGHVNCVIWCVAMCANVNAQDVEGSQHWAPVLLDAGASIDAPTTSRCTPLDRAIANKRNIVAQLLIDRGAMLSDTRFGGMCQVPLNGLSHSFGRDLFVDVLPFSLLVSESTIGPR
jgi:ankyrin repeat protein